MSALTFAKSPAFTSRQNSSVLSSAKDEEMKKSVRRGMRRYGKCGDRTLLDFFNSIFFLIPLVSFLFCLNGVEIFSCCNEQHAVMCARCGVYGGSLVDFCDDLFCFS